MVNKIKYYNLPQRRTPTTDIDVYLKAWRELAEPIERALGLTLMGFDPSFQFRLGNAQGAHTTVDLPVWFVKLLSDTLSKTKEANRDLKDVMMMVQEQFRICATNMPDEFDGRVYGWVDDTVAGTPPNLRG